MTCLSRPDRKVAASFSAAASGSNPRAKTLTSISPLTLRLTREERSRLEVLADGMTLSAYVRACLFAEDAKLRKRRPYDAVADRRAAAEALALLGQSRIAGNLNQLAHHANLGILIVGDRERTQIAEAHDHVSAIRTLLLQALGKRP